MMKRIDGCFLQWLKPPWGGSSLGQEIACRRDGDSSNATAKMSLSTGGDALGNDLGSRCETVQGWWLQSQRENFLVSKWWLQSQHPKIGLVQPRKIFGQASVRRLLPLQRHEGRLQRHTGREGMAPWDRWTGRRLSAGGFVAIVNYEKFGI